MKSIISIKRCLICTSVLALATLLPAFSLLWVRNQINIQSHYGRLLEQEFDAICRQIGSLNVQIACIQSPEFLGKYLVGKFASPTDAHTLWISTRERTVPTTFLTLNRSVSDTTPL
jgi:hypothetical protein